MYYACGPELDAFIPFCRCTDHRFYGFGSGRHKGHSDTDCRGTYNILHHCAIRGVRGLRGPKLLVVKAVYPIHITSLCNTWCQGLMRPS